MSAPGRARRRPYLRYEPPRVTDDGYRLRRALMLTADAPGGFRHWSNLADFRRTVSRVYRELRRAGS